MTFEPDDLNKMADRLHHVYWGGEGGIVYEACKLLRAAALEIEEHRRLKEELDRELNGI